MNIYSFDGNDLKLMLVGSANLLAEKKAEIDSLNVFPVPDGDTGTNMYLTMLSGVKEARAVEGSQIGAVALAMARGCLLGARGNSGVILSQIMYGLAQGLEGLERATASDVARSFRMGTDAAYKAVMNPVEGTILTVCRRMSESFGAASGRGGELVRAMVQTCRQANFALEETPELLPVLKQAGVVDAGGKGLVVILQGILRALRDAAARKNMELFDLAAIQQKDFAAGRAGDLGAEIAFTYCTEFLLRGRNIPLENLRQELSPYGDCLLVVGDDTVAKVHIHSNHPGLVLECGLKYGALHTVQINNMEDQHQSFKQADLKEERPLGIVSVGVGEGITTILKSMGVDVVISGGQTMNPSAEDILEAIEAAAALRVIVLPNNKNVILAAEQAARLSPREVAVVPTTSITQGCAALLGYNPFWDLAANIASMKESALSIRSGEVTRAVRDLQINTLTVKKGDYIGLQEDELVVAGEELHTVLEDLIKRMDVEDAALITLYYGGGIGGREAEVLAEKLRRLLPHLEVELHYGGQPLYQFIVSVE